MLTMTTRAITAAVITTGITKKRRPLTAAKSVGGLFCLLFWVAGCASPPPYVYHYVPGETAIVQNGYAVAPASAPGDVQAAVAAGNRIANLPYVFGAGHAVQFDSAYDCSSATSFVLQAAGKLRTTMPARAFRHYDESGPGAWISVYARRHHVFLVVAGLRFDTAWTKQPRGPRWTILTRPTDGFVIRHPVGL